MDATNYSTYFWIQDTSGTSGTFTVNIYRTSGSSSYKITIYYSTDGTTWTSFGTTSSGGTLSKSFSAGTKVYLKCTSNYWSRFIGSNSIAHQITANKYHSVGGNIMSLIYGDNFVGKKTFPDDSIKGIFLRIFYQNTYLTNASELVLPVTHSTSTLPTSQNNDVCLASVYSRMFYGCTALVNGPHIDLRARGTYDLPYCFQSMFQGCTNLMSVHCNTQAGNYRFNSMFNSSAAASGSTFYDYSGGPRSSEIPTARMTYQRVISMYLPTYDRVVDWTSSVSGRVWKVTDNNDDIIYLNEDAAPIDATVPFYVENISNETETVSIRTTNNSYSISVYQSNDKTNWSLLGTTSTTALTFDLTPGQRVYLIANTNSWQYNSIKGSSKVGGNIMSLLYGTNFTGQETSFPGATSSQFSGLFSGNYLLTDASELILPVVSLTNYCYSNMFYNCRMLTSVPELPATTLAPECYSAMFGNCESLTTAPDLLATALVMTCYSSMFSGCSILRYVKCLATSGIDTNYSTLDWLYDVWPTGTFVKAAGVTWPTGDSGIPSGWTVQEV